MRVKWLLCLFSLWVSLGVADPLVEIRVDGDEVRVRVEDLSLPEGQIEALEAYARESMDGLRFDLKIRGDQARSLKERLQKIPAGDRQAIDEAIEAALADWEEERDKREEKGEAGSERIYFGDSFEVGADEVLDTLVAVGSHGVVRGRVDTLVAVGSDIQLKSGAQIVEELVVIGAVVNKEPGSRVDAQEVAVMASKGGDWVGNLMPSLWELFFFSWPLTLLTSFVGLLLSIGLGSLLLYVKPDFFQSNVNRFHERTGFMFGMGLLGYLALVPVAICLVLTIVGIVLVPLYLMIFASLVLYGQFVAAAYIGQRLPFQQRLTAYKALIVGLVVVAALRLIPILGTAFVIVIGIVGFGSVMVGIGRYLKKQPSQPVTPFHLQP